MRRAQGVVAGEGLESAEMKGEVTPAECAGKNVTAYLCLQSREGTQERGERREQRGERTERGERRGERGGEGRGERGERRRGERREEERGVLGIFVTGKGQQEPAGNAASPQHP